MLSRMADPGVTQRFPATALFTIDAEDRFTSYAQKRAAPNLPYAQNASPYNFQITKPSMLNGYMTRLGVTEVVFPWAIPNINVKTNQIILSYQIGPAVPATALLQVPSGFYTPSQLAAYLTTQIGVLTGVPGFATVTYGGNLLTADNVPIFSYAVADAINNKIAFQPVPYNTAAYPFPPTTKQLFDLLGFTTGGISGNDVLTGSPAYGLVTFCQAIRYVDIVCPQLAQCQSLADATTQEIGRTALCRIYLTSEGASAELNANDPSFCPVGCRPTTIYKMFSLPKQIRWNAIQNMTSSLNFQVYDDAGALLNTSDITAGFTDFCDWSMTILASEN
jgi:hypothetical protein